jgi:hypothetical protein
VRLNDAEIRVSRNFLAVNPISSNATGICSPTAVDSHFKTNFQASAFFSKAPTARAMKPQQCRNFPDGWNFPGCFDDYRNGPDIVPFAECWRRLSAALFSMPRSFGSRASEV